MSLIKPLSLTALLAASLTACVYVPVVEESKTAESECKTYTKDMSLDVVEVHANISHDCQNQECLGTVLAAAAVVTAGSVIISGSIVLTGKTVHWLEYQGTCSDGYLNTTKQLFLDSLSKLNPNKASNK